MIGKSALFARNAIQQFVRHGSHGGVPGENLPFQIQNPYRFTLVAMLYFGSSCVLPFAFLHYNIVKK